MKKTALYLLKLSISGGLLYLVFSRTGITDFGLAFSALNGWVLPAAFAAILTQTALNAYRWLYVMRFFGVESRFPPILRITFISLLVNQGLPSFIGGDALRVYWLNREEQKLKDAVYSVLVDRIVALIGLAALMIAGAPIFAVRFGLTQAAETLLLLSGVTVAGIALFFALPLISRAVGNIRLIRNLAEVASRTTRLLGAPKFGLAVVSQALAIHGLSVVATFVLAYGFGLALSFWDLLIVIPPVILISVVPISIAGWGVREGAMVVALGMLGVPAESALAVSVTVGGLALVNGLCGLPLLIFGPERFAGVADRKVSAERGPS